MDYEGVAIFRCLTRTEVNDKNPTGWQEEFLLQSDWLQRAGPESLPEIIGSNPLNWGKMNRIDRLLQEATLTEVRVKSRMENTYGGYQLYGRDDRIRMQIGGDIYSLADQHYEDLPVHSASK